MDEYKDKGKKPHNIKEKQKSIIVNTIILLYLLILYLILQTQKNTRQQITTLSTQIRNQYYTQQHREYKPSQVQQNQKEPHEKIIHQNYKRSLENEDDKLTIAYVISITSCDANARVLDGAAVLQHSIHSASIKASLKYDYQMIAIVYKQDDDSCKATIKSLQNLNYIVQVKELPFDISKIKSDHLRKHIHDASCCGASEFIKLYAYTFVEYPIAVHVDIDVMVLQPLDNLFDIMLSNSTHLLHGHAQFPNLSYQGIEAYFTRDYNMISMETPRNKVGVQGGFFVVRPNLDYFEELIDIILNGTFPNFELGWGGEGYGAFYGVYQIQGILAYFFSHVHPSTSIELNRCIYNNMVDPPRYHREKRGKSGKCMIDWKDECENCRLTPLSNVKVAHFTICLKPWTCPIFDSYKFQLCQMLHKEWFDLRKDLEYIWERLRLIDSTVENDETDFKLFLFGGYCTDEGDEYYIPMIFPKQRVPDLRMLTYS